jgi:hypothetical protein
MTQKTTRRQAIKAAIMAIPAMAVAKISLAMPVASPVRSKLMATAVPLRNIDGRNDVTVMIRNFFANRCPILTRASWTPSDQPDAVSRQPSYQTFRMPVQTVGYAQAKGPQPFPGGIQSPLDFNMQIQLQHMVDDVEYSIYYGCSEKSNELGCTPTMDGLCVLIQTNKRQPPQNYSGYSLEDFRRDTVDAVNACGGEVDTIVVSSNFQEAFVAWQSPLTRVDCGETVFGTPIATYMSEAFPGVSFIESPLLHPFTAIALTGRELSIRSVANPHWIMKGNRGDMVEGEWAAEMAVALTNEDHFAWVSGITKFAKAA